MNNKLVMYTSDSSNTLRSILILLWMCFLQNNLASALESGYFLKWDSDHTERQIRPVYPIDNKKINDFKVYQVTVEGAKPISVCFFTFSQASNSSDFGAHCMRFAYDDKGITRSFFNTIGQQVVNAEGVYQEYYVLNGNHYPSAKRYLNEGKALIENKSGVAEYHFKRDQQGRRINELRKDAQGNVVLEHNGFYEARFAFDDNDYAIYRKGYDKNGHSMEGPNGYASAYFWFDDNGTFLKEEFRDSKEYLVLGPSGDYARIEYNEIDQFGHWHKVKFFDEGGELLNDNAAFAIADYNDFYQRTSINFYDIDMKPTENSLGVAEYRYEYDSKKNFVKRKAYSLTDKLLTE